MGSRRSTSAPSRTARRSSAAAKPICACSSSRLDVVLSPRQELILSKVVVCYQQTEAPVGSKVLSADRELSAGPSTIRNELALLEEHGLLAHPHPSAGRVPTDAGYRYFVDKLLPATAGNP